jgi:hypothetical protein
MKMLVRCPLQLRSRGRAGLWWTRRCWGRGTATPPPPPKGNCSGHCTSIFINNRPVHGQHARYNFLSVAEEEWRHPDPSTGESTTGQLGDADEVVAGIAPASLSITSQCTGSMPATTSCRWRRKSGGTPTPAPAKPTTGRLGHANEVVAGIAPPPSPMRAQCTGSMPATTPSRWRRRIVGTPDASTSESTTGRLGHADEVVAGIAPASSSITSQCTGSMPATTSCRWRRKSGGTPTPAPASPPQAGLATPTKW